MANPFAETANVTKEQRDSAFASANDNAIVVSQPGQSTYSGNNGVAIVGTFSLEDWMQKMGIVGIAHNEGNYIFRSKENNYPKMHFYSREVQKDGRQKMYQILFSKRAAQSGRIPSDGKMGSWMKKLQFTLLSYDSGVVRFNVGFSANGETQSIEDFMTALNQL